MYDVDIRRRLLDHWLRQAARRSLIVEEMGIMAGAVRADVAVIGDRRMAAYEIKSPHDTLARLPMQAMLYGYVFDRCTLVADGRTLDKAASLLPEWWGLLEARPNRRCRGGIGIITRRHNGTNPDLSVIHIGGLLWGEELREELRSLGVTKGLWKPKGELLRTFADRVTVDELRAIVRRRLKARTDWRSPKP